MTTDRATYTHGPQAGTPDPANLAAAALDARNSETVIAVCRRVSDRATGMIEKARWSGTRLGDQLMVGRRGIAEGIVADYLFMLSSAVAREYSPEAAYNCASDGLRAAIKRFNAQVEWQVQRSDDFGQDTLRFAFWELQDACTRAQGGTREGATVAANDH